MSDDKKHKTDAEKSQYRRDKLKAATPENISKADLLLMSRMRSYAKQLSDSTGIPYEVDHIIPIEGGLGLNIPANLQIITQEENRKKGNQYPYPPIEGAILASHFSEDGKVKGKFVKGISGNPKGRPKKIDLQDDKTQKLLFELYIESQGDKEEFKRLVLANGNKLKIGLEDLLGIIKKFEDISLTKQKVDKNTEEKITEIKFVLTSEENYDKIISRYMEDK